MRCPKCSSEKIELNVFFRIEPEKEFVEVEIWCPECEEVVAFYRIQDEDWITTIT